LKILGKVAVGVVGECWNFSGHSCGAHHADNFATAQLSCLVSLSGNEFISE